MFVFMDILPLRLTFQYTSAVILFRILLLNEVSSLRSLFETVELQACSARRIPSDVKVLRVPRVSKERAKHNFAYWGAVLWNSIPVCTRRLTSLEAFKISYLLYLKSKLPFALDDQYDY